jgi:heme exporter protein D
MVDYYAMMAYSANVIVIGSILLAIPIGLYHTVKSRHTHIDDVADELL